jgi:hypothetical protein
MATGGLTVINQGRPTRTGDPELEWRQKRGAVEPLADPELMNDLASGGSGAK